jgi:tRNA-dihydrouridine synthase B
MITIGSIKIDTNIFLAPMSGCTDLSFRLIAREYGAKFCFFEMADANSIIHGTIERSEILKTNKSDHPIAAQLVGADADLIVKAAKILIAAVDPKFLDINAACPVNKVLKKKAGSYLLKEPARLFEIVKKTAQALDIPVTVKLRTGFSKRDVEHILSVAKGCEKNGAAALFVHGRTRDEGYSGEPDYEAIRAIKHSVKIPVFGSGNIMDPVLAKKMLDLTDCDGILVARGAFGNPWIFSNIEKYLKTGDKGHEPSLDERKTALRKHLSYIDMYKDKKAKGKIGHMRKVALWYLKSFPNAAKLRSRVNVARSYPELLELIGLPAF